MRRRTIFRLLSIVALLAALASFAKVLSPCAANAADDNWSSQCAGALATAVGGAHSDQTIHETLRIVVPPVMGL